MAAKSNAPPSGPVPEYDPEIKDMASYIHNYKIDSELAVGALDSKRPRGKMLMFDNRLTRHDWSSSTRLVAV